MLLRTGGQRFNGSAHPTGSRSLTYSCWEPCALVRYLAQSYLSCFTGYVLAMQHITLARPVFEPHRGRRKTCAVLAGSSSAHWPVMCTSRCPR